MGLILGCIQTSSEEKIEDSEINELAEDLDYIENITDEDLLNENFDFEEI